MRSPDPFSGHAWFDSRACHHPRDRSWPLKTNGGRSTALCHEGTDPDVQYLELVANSDREDYREGQ